LKQHRSRRAEQKTAGFGGRLGVVEESRVLREYPITLGRLEGLGRRGRVKSADYVLVYRNRKLAVNEAKAWDAPLTEGVAQAKDYAGKMQVRFAYATNGQSIYWIDMQTGRARGAVEGDVRRGQRLARPDCGSAV
jgi:type I site-specific restriction endonuclease